MRMTEFDSFSTQLLEESKALLEKAKSAEPFTQSAYLHAGLLLTMSALEACVNSHGRRAPDRAVWRQLHRL